MPWPRPSLSEPSTASGPMQKMSEVSTNPSTKRDRPSPAFARENFRWMYRPPASSRSSIRRSDPVTPPMRSAPRTMSRGAASPTASVKSPSTRAMMFRAPMTSVTRPSASVTVTRVRSGMRWPSSTPREAPTRIATTLMMVPRPITRASKALSDLTLAHASRLLLGRPLNQPGGSARTLSPDGERCTRSTDRDNGQRQTVRAAGCTPLIR